MSRWQDWPSTFQATVVQGELLAHTGHDLGAARETFLRAALIAPDSAARQEMRGDRAKQCLDRAITEAVQARRARRQVC